MTVFRWLATFLLLCAVGTSYGNALHVDYLGQAPENVVLEGAAVNYSFENSNVDDGSSLESDGIGTGMQISVDGTLVRADSGVFSSEGCIVDVSFPDTWACLDLDKEGDSQEYSFTWTPAAGTYVVSFLGLCQELPIPSSGPRFCDVNEGVPTVAYVTTEVSPDTDGDGDPDGSDPDDDNDGIIDDLDTQPLVPNNVCTGGDADNATLGQAIVDELTCAARVSIDVEGTTEVMGFPAHLRLIAPYIGFQNGFDVLEGGRLSVFSTNPCPGCGGYQIGDTGPAGGIVFHVTDGGYHGLEAALADQASAPWGCYGTVTGAAGTAIGTGAQNTAIILEACGERPIAASIAFDYSQNGFDDWYLPSLDELYQLSLHATIVGGFVLDDYWSSSESDFAQAWYVLVPNAFIYFDVKNTAKRVRPVRAF